MLCIRDIREDSSLSTDLPSVAQSSSSSTERETKQYFDNQLTPYVLFVCLVVTTKMLQNAV